MDYLHWLKQNPREAVIDLYFLLTAAKVLPKPSVLFLLLVLDFLGIPYTYEKNRAQALSMMAL